MWNLSGVFENRENSAEKITGKHKSHMQNNSNQNSKSNQNRIKTHKMYFNQIASDLNMTTVKLHRLLRSGKTTLLKLTQDKHGGNDPTTRGAIMYTMTGEIVGIGWRHNTYV